MAYVNLNPIRAGIAKSLSESQHTGIKKRLDEWPKAELNRTIKAIAGKVKNRTMVLKLSDYIELVEWTGQAIVYLNKSKIPAHLSRTFEQLNLNQDNWLNQVQAYGRNYYGFVGDLQRLTEKIQSFNQQWSKGIQQINKLYLTPS